MSGPFLLLKHSLKRMRSLVLTMGLLLGAFQIVLVMVAGSIQRSGGFEQLSAMLPPFAREMMGPSMAGFMSFGGIVCLGYFHLIVMGSLVGLAIAIATVPAAEVETGFIDLILSRPLARHWIITRSMIAVILAVVAVLGLMMTGTWIGLETLAPPGADWPSVTLIRSLATNLGLLMLCWGGVALAIGSAARRRSIAGASTALLALTAFLLDYVGRLWQPAQSVAWLSPFRYYSTFDLVLGAPLPLKNVAVLGGIALAGWLAAYALFARRDLVR
jgi:ABC-type transport system involved in multi-copper enzyme maturation permease subunit